MSEFGTPDFSKKVKKSAGELAAEVFKLDNPESYRTPGSAAREVFRDKGPDAKEPDTESAEEIANAAEETQKLAEVKAAEDEAATADARAQLNEVYQNLDESTQDETSATTEGLAGNTTAAREPEKFLSRAQLMQMQAEGEERDRLAKEQQAANKPKTKKTGILGGIFSRKK